MKAFKFYMILGVGLVCLTLHHAKAQPTPIQSGPMVGYSEMREAMLWVQTKSTGYVKATYAEKEKPKKTYSTNIVQTKAHNAHVAHLLADSVQPGKTYHYDIWYGKQPDQLTKLSFDYPTSFQSLPDWRHRTPPPNYSFVFGSGAYINEPQYDRKGKSYGGEYFIFKTIYDHKPDFMIWAGDNIYLRPADYGSKTGIYHRYTHTRSAKVFQPLLASVHHYAIWDDHDYGPNDSDKSYVYKHTALQAFKDFWANPNYQAGGLEGPTGWFRWGDAEFFMLDNRWYRDPNYSTAKNKNILGPKQIKWLIAALRYSHATFKFVVVGGQFLNPGAKYENHATYPEERQHLIDTLLKERIEGVVFLTGDRHHSEITKLDRQAAYPLYDITSSPFTSGTHKPDLDENTLRVKGTLVNERNFVQVSISGVLKNRVMTITCINNKGEKLWEHSLNENDLKF